MALLARTVKPAPSPEGQAAASPQEVTALLQRGASFEGKLSFEGTVHINGAFTGEIHSPDTLVVGEGADVRGEIDVGTAIINGGVEGHLRARQLVEMHAPARFRGTVMTPALVIDRGVIFDGTVQMESLDTAAPAGKPPAPRPVKG